jgi:hypothetical protein
MHFASSGTSEGAAAAAALVRARQRPDHELRDEI